jgi:hypothetical protein
MPNTFDVYVLRVKYSGIYETPEHTALEGVYTRRELAYQRLQKIQDLLGTDATKIVMGYTIETLTVHDEIL